MTSTTGGDEVQDSTVSSDKSSVSPNSSHRSLDKNGGVSPNGTVPCPSSESIRKTNAPPSLFLSPSPSVEINVTPSSTLLTPKKTMFCLKPSKFGSAAKLDSSSSPILKPGLLRASALEPVVNSTESCSPAKPSPAFHLSLPKLKNPFNDDSSKEDTVTSSDERNCQAESEKPKVSNCSTNTTQPVSFVPLAYSNSVGSSSTIFPSAVSTTSASSFVFGQNLHERVEGTEVPQTDTKSCTETVVAVDKVSKVDDSKTNGASPQMLFSSVLQQEQSDKQEETMSSEERKRKTISEAAREYEESRAVKRKYEEVTVKTGEEEEMNILQLMNCKLFAFNKEKSTWSERGRGNLRLNDLSLDNNTQSRVVMRVAGSHRVVLNTKIWAGMAVDRASEKTVRLTAMDGGGEVKVFLVKAGVSEIDQLHKALVCRVDNQKKLADMDEKTIGTMES